MTNLTTHLANPDVVLVIDYILHNSVSYHALLGDPTTSPSELSSIGALICKEYHDRSSKVAQQPHTDPHPAAELDVLSALLSDIYRNPNTPLPTLLKVTASHIKDFLENPALHLHFLENTQFLSFLNYNAQEALVKATDDPALLSFPWKNYNTKLALANNPHTPVHILQNLAGDLYAAHRSAAASNPQMPADVLHLLRKLGGHRLLQGDAPDYRAFY